MTLAEAMKKNECGQYLIKILDESEGV